MPRARTRYILAADTETSYTNEGRNARQVILAGYKSISDREQKNAAAEKVAAFGNLEDFFSSITNHYYSKDAKGKQLPIYVFFHNLDYDLSYIEDWALNREQPLVLTEVRDYRTKTVYQGQLIYNDVTITLLDSLKYYPGTSIEMLGHMVGVEKLVGSFDYDKLYQPGVVTQEELGYFKHDIIILQRVLKQHFQGGRQVKLTRPGYSFAALKHEVYSADQDTYEKIFKPKKLTKSLADYIRKSYYGGFTWVNPEFANKPLGRGFVFDVNSLYPSQMVGPMPVFDSIQAMTADQLKVFDFKDPRITAVMTFDLGHFKLKPGKFPSIPKKSNFRANDPVYSDADLISPIVTITGLDYLFLLDNYDVHPKFLHGYYFLQYVDAPFKRFIDKNNAAKVKAAKSGDKLGRLMAKLTNNMSYGKFGQRSDFVGALPYYDKISGVIRYSEQLEDDDQEYLPNILIATVITSRARFVLFSAIKAVNESKLFDFCYCDTDSIHVLNYTKLTADQYLEVAKLLPIKIDPVKLGQWKLENDFDRAKFLRSKVYYEDSEFEGQVVKAAGVSPKGKQEIAERIQHDGLESFCFPLTVTSTRKHRIPGGYDIEEYQKTLDGYDAKVIELEG